MGRVLPENPEFSNTAEEIIYNTCRDQLSDGFISYFNYTVGFRESDFMVLIPGKGIAIIEVKGLYPENIIEVVDNNKILYQKNSGEVIPMTSPFKQARQYCFNLVDKIKDDLNKNYKVLHFVCYPFIDEIDFDAKNLNLISRREVTILRNEILSGNMEEQLLNIFDQVQIQGCDPFNEEGLIAVRSLFESKEDIISSDKYSFLQIIPGETSDIQIEQLTEEIISLWNHGVKIYLVSNSMEILTQIRDELEEEIKNQGIDEIFATRNNDGEWKDPFNFMSYITDTDESVLYPLQIFNGEHKLVIDNIDLLENINKGSAFNLEQYQIEHSAESENMLIMAGAGTGKTYSMISRVSYLIYLNNRKKDFLRDSIVLITFTNKAADNMQKKLKLYLQNMFQLTGIYDYMEMIQVVNNMKISTIHSLSRKIIEKFSAKLGLGKDFQIVSGKKERRRILEDTLNQYIMEKQKQDTNFTSKLGISMYNLVKRLTGLLNKLESKSIDIARDKCDFGVNNELPELHDLIIDVVRETEKNTREEMRLQNKIRLSNIVICLKELVREKIDEIKSLPIKYVFVDEFQDTDDTQIDLLNEFQQLIGFQLFIVGDIKQCIYRFRGAEDQAFSRLLKANNLSWKEDNNLLENYRTDKLLLQEMEEIFRSWDKSLIKFKYDTDDNLRSHLPINKPEDEYFREIKVEDEEDFVDKFKKELTNSYNELDENGSIAILVRENKEIKNIVDIGEEAGYYIETDVGGTLYQEKPTLDFLKLIKALKYPHTAKYLYNLFDTAYIYRSIPVSWLAAQGNNVEKNKLLECIVKDFYEEPPLNKWEESLDDLTKMPVLKVLRELVMANRPWVNIPQNIKDPISKKRYKRYYKRNLDLLFEKIISNSSLDYVTLNNIENFLEIMIYTGQEEESREILGIDEEQEKKIFCMTVHKAKGLEFDTVILPYTNNDLESEKKQGFIDLISNSSKSDLDYKIGYKLKIDKNLNNNYPGKYHTENIIYEDLNDIERQHKLAEETRILYVAMTRAIKNLSYFYYSSGNENKITWQKLIRKEV